MKNLNWNTGRMYTPEGQLIEAALVASDEDEFGFTWHTVEFHDRSRMVSGRITNLLDFTETAIMAAYDAGYYQSIQPN